MISRSRRNSPFLSHKCGDNCNSGRDRLSSNRGCDMDFKELGSTEVKLPEIGLGTWNYRGGVEPLRKAIELGANLIDTAELYGTDDVVGEAVKGRRDKVFVATKVSANHLRHAEVLRAAEQSLKKLGMDYIDLYQ